MKVRSVAKSNTGNLVVLLLLGLYLVSPVDAIPDFVPALGWIDDLLVILWTVFKIMDRTDKKSNSVLGFFNGLFTVGVILIILFAVTCILLIVSLFD